MSERAYKQHIPEIIAKVMTHSDSEINISEYFITNLK